MTFKEIEQYWHDQLEGQYDDREALSLFYYTLQDVAQISRVDFLVKRSELVDEETKAKIFEVLNKLKAGIPYQHVVGFTFFNDLKILTSPAALIPRPETEELVHWVFEYFNESSKITLEDFCTGTGCIPLALKSVLVNAKVLGSDLSDEALSLANQNAAALKLDVSFRKEDVFNPENKEMLDVITANPPYIPEQERTEMLARVLDYEPHIALFVPDNDPLLFYRQIASLGLTRLQVGGSLYFELHENYAIQTKELVEMLGYQNVELRQDLQGKWRMLRAVKG